MPDSNSKLWAALHSAYYKAWNPPYSYQRMWAAAIRALVDWLLPEEPEPPMFIPSELGGSIIQAEAVAEWKVRSKLRAQLLAEAAIADQLSRR